MTFARRIHIRRTSKGSRAPAMFYRTEDDHGLRHNPFNAIIVPRPIGWISSCDAEGRVNLAPYSFFNGVAYHPPQIMYASTGDAERGEGLKDSIANIRETGEFAVNLVSYALREAMNRSAVPAPRAVDEFEVAGLTKAPCETIGAPRVAESPVTLECRLVQIVDLPATDPATPNRAVFGHVTAIHIADAVIVDGLVDIGKLAPIARLGYRDYARVGEVFSMTRPTWPIAESGDR